MTGPKPGDRVHLTLTAVVDPLGRYHVDYSKDLTISTGATFPVHSTSWYHPDASCIVRVEPAPPPPADWPRVGGPIVVRRSGDHRRPGGRVLHPVA